jgi:hypothetical protein
MAYWSCFGCFTWKLGAFEAQFHAFVEGACGYLAHLVQFWRATNRSVWAYAFLHSGTFFTGDSTNTDSHIPLTFML